MTQRYVPDPLGKLLQTLIVGGFIGTMVTTGYWGGALNSNVTQLKEAVTRLELRLDRLENRQ